MKYEPLLLEIYARRHCAFVNRSSPDERVARVQASIWQIPQRSKGLLPTSAVHDGIALRFGKLIPLRFCDELGVSILEPRLNLKPLERWKPNRYKTHATMNKPFTLVYPLLACFRKRENFLILHVSDEGFNSRNFKYGSPQTGVFGRAR